ncbi:hypothetical protein EDC01DRAFT_121782 [Geopyxis carbonaria]|nr:hypothetical protein EDC01DRAFT_121782 [Geopyxis carbonaria]
MAPPTPLSTHLLQNAGLISLSLLSLPITTAILLASLASTTPPPPPTPAGGKKTVLISALAMSKGLTLARTFHAAGHRVIGLDFDAAHFAHTRVRSPGAFSRCLSAHYTVAAGSGYTAALVKIIKEEQVDLFIPVSGVATTVLDAEAREVIERETACRVLMPTPKSVAILHDKATFIEAVEKAGLTTPLTVTVESPDAALTFLESEKARGKRFIMKCLPLDDASRADMTLLPFPARADTLAWLEHPMRGISPKRPWIVQEFVAGREYCTHAVMVRGKLTAFVACPSLELLMHYTALPAHEALSKKMERWTVEMCKTLDGGAFTGQVSFDFLVREGEETLYPIECNPRTHTAVQLLAEDPQRLAGAYLALLDDAKGKEKDTKTQTDDSKHALNGANGAKAESTVYHAPPNTSAYFWLPHDLVTLLVLPLIKFATNVDPVALAPIKDFALHLCMFKDATFDAADPLPWWWMYQVYYPWMFVISLLEGRRWSRVNVSTTRVFESS